MISELWVWLILFLPLCSFVVIGLGIRPFMAGYSQLSGLLTIVSIGASFGLSLWALGSVMVDHATVDSWTPHTWLTVGDLKIDVGILLDP